ncbi:MAG: rRNA maturation RNase YbeY [Candidatus Neomarinimicrobiota bacterium]
MISVLTEVADGDVTAVSSTVEEFVKTAMNRGGVEDGTVTVILTNDQTLRELQLRFREKNEFTDVLAFRLDSGKSEPMEGEIYISVERATENSKKYGVSLADELSRLIFHGCLHLAGHKDSTQIEKTEMRQLEDQLLEQAAVGSLLKH